MILERKCPKCNDLIVYKSALGLKVAVKKDSICRKCAVTGENNGMYGHVGKLNPFFCKKHTNGSIEKIRDSKLGKKHRIESLQKMKGISAGEKNPMFGKNFYNIWVEKYGEDEANIKLSKWKDKHSKNNSGSGNPMFGKPSPQGSGNGWSGWYKGWYFRSVGELTYMVKIIERFGLKWVSGESSKYKIKYFDFSGNKRTYFPDFIINGKYIIESKPKRLWSSDNVLRKKEAAIKFANEFNFKYKLVDVGKLTDLEIKKLYDNGLIKFIDRYEKLYQEKFNGK